jgi:hypothetical protein
LRSEKKLRERRVFLIFVDICFVSFIEFHSLHPHNTHTLSLSSLLLTYSKFLKFLNKCMMKVGPFSSSRKNLVTLLVFHLHSPKMINFLSLFKIKAFLFMMYAYIYLYIYIYIVGVVQKFFKIINSFFLYFNFLCWIWLNSHRSSLSFLI